MENVGNVCYLVNFHDGVKEHRDGSAFFDIRTFTNKKDLGTFTASLIEQGYTEG